MEENNENISPAVRQDHIENMVKPKRVIKISLFFLLLFVSILFSLGIGYYWGVGGPENIKQRIVGQDAPIRYQDIDFSRFWEALEIVEGKFIGEMDYSRMIDGAIAGMVSSLEDPFTTYFNKETLKEFNSEINGTFEGIGAEISIRNNDLIIVSPLAGSPAEKSGLMAGDIINSIDGESVINMTIDEAIMKIRGDRGTSVVLNIKRVDQPESFDINIKRDVINIKSVQLKLNNDGTAYIRILRFDPSTNQLLDQIANQLKDNGVKGIVLDLRNNPGGYLESAIDVTSQFIKEGVVVFEEYKGGEKEALNSNGRGKLVDIPMVVLINGGSASASEILAGALRDHKRGILIGEKTFGKGSVQEMQVLKEGGALKITIAKWLTPNGSAIDKTGIMPDIEILWEKNQEVGKDNQLEKAYEEIGKIIK
uniref:S41 family peptidase n=1 Tax=candidate division CPR3 bacterium TaxID=2268181 RepID=A0A7C4LZD6_UNCC3